MGALMESSGKPDSWRYEDKPEQMKVLEGLSETSSCTSDGGEGLEEYEVPLPDDSTSVRNTDQYDRFFAGRHANVNDPSSSGLAPGVLCNDAPVASHEFGYVDYSKSAMCTTSLGELDCTMYHGSAPVAISNDHPDAHGCADRLRSASNLLETPN